MSSPSIPPSLSDLPFPLFQQLVEVVRSEDIAPLRGIDQKHRRRVDATLKLLWEGLKKTLPTGLIPAGRVDLAQLMNAAETAYPAFENQDPCHLIYFKKLEAEFAHNAAKLANGRLPTTPAHYVDLQAQAERNRDEALVAIWPRILVKIPQAQQPQLNEASANEIRAWLNDNNPNIVAILNAIRELNLSDLELKMLPQEVAKLSQLQDLELFNNKIHFFPLNTLTLLPQLKTLNLSSNGIRFIPEEVLHLTQLQHLSLETNHIRSIPTGLCTLTQLTLLNLGHNQISSIPKEIENLTQLVIFCLNHNKINFIPKEIKFLTKLTDFDLKENEITFVPDYVLNMQKLSRLAIKNNKIPSLDTNCKHFQTLFNQQKTKNYRREATCKVSSRLGELYQSVICGKSKDELMAIVWKLAPEDRNEIFRRVWILAGSPPGDPQWGERHALDHLGYFYLAVRERILDKFNRLSQGEKNVVYHKVTAYRGGNFQWGKERALDNLPQLADLIESLAAMPPPTANETKALVAIWPRLLDKIPGGHAPPSAQSTPAQISTWLKGSHNADILRSITELDLSGLELEMLPREIEELSELQSLSLKNNKIDSFPSSILNLTQLKELTLSENKISSIPEAIRDLTKLQRLSLAHNLISSISKEMCALSTLEWLDLNHNQIDWIRREIQNLTQLRCLDLSHNQIPGIWIDNMCNLPMLEQLDLNHNQILSICKEVSALPKLQRLNLSHNKICFVPGDVLDMPHLVHFDISDNRILSIDVNCKDFKKLVSQERTVIYKQELRHKAHSSLARLYLSILCEESEDEIETILRQLAPEDRNEIFRRVWILAGSKPGDPQWGEHHLFDDWNLFYLAVRETILDKFNRLSQEKKNRVYGEVYRLSGNPPTENHHWGEKHALDNLPVLADAIDSSPPTEAALKDFWAELKSNPPSGPIDLKQVMSTIEADATINAKEAVYLTRFKRLQLEFAHATAEIPNRRFLATCADYENLQKQVGENRALVAIWPRIRDVIPQKDALPPPESTPAQIRTWWNHPSNAGILNSITELDLSELGLEILPQEVAKLSNLRNLSLTKNKLTSIPKNICALAKLQTLRLGGNKIRFIPEEIRDLKELQALYLWGNQISSIPKSICALQKLQILWIDSNEIRYIPEEIRGLTELQSLSLNNNQISSTPEGMCALTKLERLDLKGNKLSSIKIRGLTKLRNVNFAHNQISFIPSYVLDMAQLSWLFIEDSVFPFTGNGLIKAMDLTNSIFNETKVKYKKETTHNSSSALAKLYQAVICDKTDNEITTLLETLTSNDRDEIFKRVWVLAESPSGDPQWGKHHALEHLSHFYLAVRETILDKFNRMSQEKKNRVYGEVYRLSGNPPTENHHWGKDHVLDNLPLLADVMIIEKF